MAKKQARKKLFKALVIFGLIVLTPTVASAYYYDDFDSYSLGALSGQGIWVGDSSSDIAVSGDDYYNSPYSIKILQNPSWNEVSFRFASTTNAQIRFKFKNEWSNGGSWAGLAFSFNHNTNRGYALQHKADGHLYLVDTPTAAYQDLGAFANDGVWHDFVMIFSNFSSSSVNVSVYFDGIFATSTTHSGSCYSGLCDYMDGFDIYRYSGTVIETSYIDDLTFLATDAYGGYNTNTRIIDFTPHSSTTPVSNPINFSLYAYINEDDLNWIEGIKLTLRNVSLNTLIPLSWLPVGYLMSEMATSSGDFYYSTTTALEDGNYYVEAEIIKTYVSGILTNPFSEINDIQRHNFIVGTSTLIGSLRQGLWGDTENELASSSATTTEAMIGSCNIFSGNFDLSLCLAVLILPDPTKSAATFKVFYNYVLTKFPIGYAVRVYDIFTSTSTSTLPTFTVNIATDSSTTTALTFDPADMIAGGGALLESIHDPIYDKSPRDIFEPLVKLAIALSVIFTIVADVMGSHKHEELKNRRANV